MSSKNPILLLVSFLILTTLLYYTFRPFKGWFYLLKKNLKSNLKVAVEDILKSLYHSQENGDEITLNNLTRKLPHNNHLLTKSIDKMIENKLIYKDKDTFKLSESGNEYALRIIRAHRLWEKFLSEKTGFKKEEWHQRAEKKEHELSLEETDKLAAILGNPKFDPHGDPIPSNTGKITSKKGKPLSNLTVNSIGEIIHIEDEPDIIYKQILAENIHLGSQIRIVENNNTRIVFHAEGEKFTLAPIVAKNITVVVLEKNTINEENIARLSSLKLNETAEIIGISKECRGENRRRLLDLGFVKNAKVSVDLLNPLKDPKAFLIKGTSIALRNNQAEKILIKKV
ncbi:iron dependent repressor, metal binding and dimerization domain protein [Tenacibaculum sp. UWU-22]|uniref:metal-dependent transcriptional regulator n=1 Tax=Tenacibaculum sp. UWU-22 TaxID=3234187 RepID=UPI0034DB3A74